MYIDPSPATGIVNSIETPAYVPGDEIGTALHLTYVSASASQSDTTLIIALVAWLLLAAVLVAIVALRQAFPARPRRERIDPHGTFRQRYTRRLFGR